MKCDGLILDVDGTLWDSTEIAAEVWEKAIRECGFKDFRVNAAELKGYFGKTMDVIAALMLPEASENDRRLIMDKCCLYENEALLNDTRAIDYPHVRETIRALSKRLPVTIVSNCQAGYIEAFLEKTDLAEYVCDIECFGNNGLPKADNISLIVKRNGFLNPCYVGDTDGDLSSCKKTGVPFIFASYGFGSVPLSECAAVISDFGELLELL